MVEYELKSIRRAKRITVTVRRDGSVVVTKPVRVSRAAAEVFVAKSAPWISAAKERFLKRPRPVVRSKEEQAKEYRENKTRALALARSRAEHFAPILGVSAQRISIRNQRTRWGSCSRRGSLSFNYRLALLPRELADYVVVHELCHLVHHNHSPRFWKLVGTFVPEYAALRRALRAQEKYLLQ